MKESANYQFLKTFSNDYIHHIRISNCFNGPKKFRLDELNINQLLSIIENNNIKKSCIYIEQRYLNNKFNEDKLIQLLCKLIYPTTTFNKHGPDWIPTISYFKNLPLHVYFKAIEINTNVFKNISKDTKNYNEIKEFYRFLKL